MLCVCCCVWRFVLKNNFFFKRHFRFYFLSCCRYCYYYSGSCITKCGNLFCFLITKIFFRISLVFFFSFLIKWLCVYLPRSTIFPNRFLPRRKLRVEQFQRRFLNWCWHSLMAKLAPLTRAPNTPGLSRTKRRCFLLSVVCMAGSTYIIPELMGEILFGSPTLAMPL